MSESFSFSYDEATSIINNTLGEALEAASPAIAKEYLQSFISEIDNYLTNLENFYQEIGNKLAQVDLQYANCIDVSNTTIRYSALSRIDYSQAQIENLLKMGFTLIEQIRSILTKQEIKYSIAITSKNEAGDIAIEQEVQMSLRDLLKYLTTDKGTEGKIENAFKLRMTRSKVSFEQSLKSADAELTQIIQPATTIWSAVHRYVTKQRGAGTKVGNWGNAYEVYRDVIQERRSNHLQPEEYPPTDEELDNYFASIKSNNVSFVKGGDYGLEQLKIYTESPSIASTETIRETLKSVRDDFQQYINSLDNAALQQSLIELFVKDTKKISEQASLEAAKEATDNIINLIQGLALQ